MYFSRKIIFYFPSVEEISFFREESLDRRKIIFQCNFFWKDHLFRTFEEYIIFPFFFFFLRKISSFIFSQKNKIIFSRKRNIIFPDHTRKIIFESNFFGKIIFSKLLEKENMVFRAVTLHIYSLIFCY